MLLLWFLPHCLVGLRDQLFDLCNLFLSVGCSNRTVFPDLDVFTLSRLPFPISFARVSQAVQPCRLHFVEFSSNRPQLFLQMHFVFTLSFEPLQQVCHLLFFLLLQIFIFLAVPFRLFFIGFLHLLVVLTFIHNQLHLLDHSVQFVVFPLAFFLQFSNLLSPFISHSFNCIFHFQLGFLEGFVVLFLD